MCAAEEDCPYRFAVFSLLHRPAESILRELADLRAKGFKEVTLLGQNVNSYRYETEDGRTVDFGQLLAMVAEAAPDMRVRF